MNRQLQVNLLKKQILQKAAEDAGKSSQEREAAGDNQDQAERGKFLSTQKRTAYGAD